MSRMLKRAAVLGAVAATVLVASPVIASAAECPGSNTCRFGPVPFNNPNNHVWVDFDVHGSGTGEYVVFLDDLVVCRANFSAADPRQTRGCSTGKSTGWIEAVVSGPQGPSMIGLRWP